MTNKTATSSAVTAVLIGLLLVAGMSAQKEIHKPVTQDIEAEVRRLLTTTSSKSEFETTEHYESRRPKLNSKEMVFALPIGEEDGDVVKFAYSADEQILTTEIWGLGSVVDVEGLSGRGLSSWLIKKRLVSTRQYVGENAFGVKKLILSYTYNQFHIVTSDAVNQLLGKYYLTLTGEEAKHLKPFLKVLVICTESDANVYQYYDHNTPTLSYPLDSICNNYYICVKVLAMVLVDSRSGDLLDTFSTKTTAPSPTP